MSDRALRECAHCGRPSHSRYCTDHLHLVLAEKKMNDERITKGDVLLRANYTWWRKARLRFLADHPLCADPYHRHEGQIRAAIQVDHIVPHKGNEQLFRDQSNWQGLCGSCGGWKSATEEGGRAHSTRPSVGDVSGVASVKWTKEMEEDCVYPPPAHDDGTK